MDPTASSPPECVNPGPIVGDVLWGQSQHRSEQVWEDQRMGALNLRNGSVVAYNDRYGKYLERARLDKVHSFTSLHLDPNLITALVERWRPETNTFHLPVGECTITLEDVSIILGLPTDGDPVTGVVPGVSEWSSLCERTIGVVPEGRDRVGSRIRTTWLRDTFKALPGDADEKVESQYARAYVLSLFGGCLFPDRSGSHVHLCYLSLLEDWDAAGKYSWGSAVLAWLYREMGRASLSFGSAGTKGGDIGGALILIQLWSWERLLSISPVPRVVNDVIPLGLRWLNLAARPTSYSLFEYRLVFDGLRSIVWEPYREKVSADDIDPCWKAVVPLICFHAVAWHHPDRVMRQFHLDPCIPPRMESEKEVRALLATDQRAQKSDWPAHHERYIRYWHEHEQHIIRGLTSEPDLLHFHSQYMQWYQSITRRFLSYRGAIFGALGDGLEHLHVLLEQPMLTSDDMEFMQRTVRSMMVASGSDIRLVPPGERPQRASQMEPFQHYPEYQPAPVERDRHGGTTIPGGPPSRRRDEDVGEIPRPYEVSFASYVRKKQPSSSSSALPKRPRNRH